MLKNINITDFWKKIIKGCLFAAILSVFFVLIFALIMRIFSLNSNIVPAVNVIIKILSVFIAILIVSGDGGKVFLKGILIAIGFIVLSNLLFLLLGGQLVFNGIIKDIIICVIVAFVASIVSVYRKK